MVRVSSGIRHLCFWSLLAATTFFCHRCLQIEYSRRCNGDLFRFIMFNESRLCSMMSYMLNTVEMVTKQGVSFVSFFLISSVNNVMRRPHHPKNNLMA